MGEGHSINGWYAKVEDQGVKRVKGTGRIARLARITIITSSIQKRLIALFYGLYVGAKVRPNACMFASIL